SSTRARSPHNLWSCKGHWGIRKSARGVATRSRSRNSCEPMTAPDASARQSALDRLIANAPFLARLAALYPDDVARYLDEGCDAPLGRLSPPPLEDDIRRAMRQWRGRIALLVALGDLAGEHDVATTTRLLTAFADQACDAALAAAFAERVPGDAPRGLSIIALGKLGSHELNYSSDIDPILIFDPETLPRRSRDDPDEAAVRIARRMV